ncbi:DUF4998 domain-containing protein [Petrimonas sp.]|uniref:DUF4998 domain-containing protein n=1 Tax=Petrimonas sp. TaxID=2023866 RepID=UPI002FC86465
MKYILSNKLFYLVTILLLLVTSSCSDMNELHDKYLAKGETIYVGRPDSAKVFGGENRLLLRYWSSDPRAKKMVVYWQLRNDSILVDMPVNRDSVDLIISNMPENNYNLELITMKEDFTFRSVPLHVSGNSYGEQFQATLQHHLIKSIKLISLEKLKIEWFAANDNEVGNEVVYSSKSGETVSRFVPFDEKETEINDYKEDIRYRTIYLPEINAIDTFYTEYRIIDIQGN